MGLTQTSKPSGEPVTLDAFKNHARIDGEHDNDAAQLLLRSATRHIEHLTARQFVNATWQYTFAAWPASGTIWIPKAPLVSVATFATGVRVTGTGRGGKAKEVDLKGAALAAHAGKRARKGRALEGSMKGQRVVAL